MTFYHSTQKYCALRKKFKKKGKTNSLSIYKFKYKGNFTMCYASNRHPVLVIARKYVLPPIYVNTQHGTALKMRCIKIEVQNRTERSHYILYWTYRQGSARRGEAMSGQSSWVDKLYFLRLWRSPVVKKYTVLHKIYPTLQNVPYCIDVYSRTLST